MLDGLLNFISAGLLNFTWFETIIALLVMTHITIAGVTIFLHRHQAHRSVDLHPVVSHFFRFWLWASTGMVTKEWVAIHRKHHAKCETPEDPHSPQTRGLKTVMWKGAELYRAEADNEETLNNYGHGTPNDWLERNVYSRFPYLGISLMAVVDVMLFGALGITVFAVQMLWIPFWAAGVINGIGHYWGYRTFETKDAARNIMPIGILIGGEEFHNNHHAYAASARLSNKWWEFDIGWFYIQLMQLFRLAKVRTVAPKARFDTSKVMVDLDTVKAVVRNRVDVMGLYGRKVIIPVIQQERQQASDYVSSIYKKAKRLMVREDIKLDVRAKAILQEALTQSDTLETVYQFKQKLKEIWARSSENQTKRVAKLQEWCAQAEQTGIKVLEDFAQSLRGYSLQTA
ncbi:MAG: aminotransferase [Gammaproteobacteria bacterium SG8_15]|nr:MAG: aminotransferase [Gammaproteobacteria bacterium SG8_15]